MYLIYANNIRGLLKKRRLKTTTWIRRIVLNGTVNTDLFILSNGKRTFCVFISILRNVRHVACYGRICKLFTISGTLKKEPKVFFICCKLNKFRLFSSRPRRFGLGNKC